MRKNDEDEEEEGSTRAANPLIAMLMGVDNFAEHGHLEANVSERQACQKRAPA